MLAAQLSAFDRPPTVEQMPRPRPEAGRVLLEMLAAPVNPADLNVIEGKYGTLPQLPSFIGNEGLGRVAELGEGVSNVAVGDLVLPMQPGTWSQAMIAEAAGVLRVPGDLDPVQGAMLTVNPPTALLMLREYVALEPGEWIVQNAANSAVGRSVIQIARILGWKTLNVVRRPELIGELRELGADAVVTEECDLRKEAGALCGGRRPRLALNAVGGASALNLANALADEGTLVTYGAMGRQPLKIPNGLLIFRGLSFQGFWLTRWRAAASPERVAEVFAAIAGWSRAGMLRLPVHRVYPLRDLSEALAEAAREARGGKVILDLAA